MCWLQQIFDSQLKLSCLQGISVHYWKCLFCSELTFVVDRVLSAANLWFAVEIVLSIANLWFIVEIELSAGNKHSLLKVCVLQRINIQCQKGVGYSESVIRCWNWVICSESTFPAESVSFATNLWFAVEIELSIVNQCFLPKVWVLQQICDSLQKLSYLQRINIRCQNCVGWSESVFESKRVLSAANMLFAAEIELSAANQRSLLKVCFL